MSREGSCFERSNAFAGCGQLLLLQLGNITGLQGSTPKALRRAGTLDAGRLGDHETVRSNRLGEEQY
jgi:hypothetical protein